MLVIKRRVSLPIDHDNYGGYNLAENDYADVQHLNNWSHDQNFESYDTQLVDVLVALVNDPGTFHVHRYANFLIS
jgi:hypothetical protein